MAWLVAMIWTVAFAASGTGGARAAVFPTSVTLAAADGTALHASYGTAANAQYGVVFVHAAGRSREDWSGVAQRCVRQGMMAITLDLRGHGAPPAPGAPPALAAADYAAMVQDVAAAARHLRDAGAKRVALVGAELGANLALNVAADDPGIVSVLLLSPGMDIKGVTTPDAVKRYGARPLLIVASEDDAYATRSAKALAATAAGEKRIELYKSAGKGTRMLNQEPTLEGLLVGFLGSHWEAGAPPPAPREVPTTQIRIGASELRTTGPLQPDPPPPAPPPAP